VVPGTVSVRILDLFRTATFKLLLAYLILFAASVIFLLGFIYWRTAGFMSRQVDQTIAAEIQGLSEQYRRRGLIGLRQIVLERASGNSGLSLYLLTAVDGRSLGGNLQNWPPETERDVSGWVNFSYQRAGRLSEARGQQMRLQGGWRLLVARDVSDLKAIEGTLENTLGYALALTALFGVIGGAWISRLVLSRLDQINQTSQEIMSGDLSRRVPVLGGRDELDELATNLNAMLDQIEVLMSGMREVADNIAHDLRTPLNRLRNRLEGAMMERETPETTRTSLESAIEEADGLIATFNSLLLIAEAESGAHRDSLVDVDLHVIAKDVAELYEPVAEERGISLVIAALEPMRVRGNPNLVARAAANLVDNALKYTPSGGRVMVSVEAGAAKGEGPVFSVRDSGPGIPTEDRDRVLDRFVRLERSRNTPGSGLGLSLVAAVARMHSATLELSDAAPGLNARLIFPKPQALAIAAQ
jgi:signal transduction histidine kinase